MSIICQIEKGIDRCFAKHLDI